MERSRNILAAFRRGALPLVLVPFMASADNTGIPVHQGPAYLDCSALKNIGENYHATEGERTGSYFTARAHRCFVSVLTNINPPATEYSTLADQQNVEITGIYDGKQRVAVNQLKIKVHGVETTFTVKFTGCDRDPFIRWDQGGAGSCSSGPIEVSVHPLGSHSPFRNRAVFFGTYGQPGEPVGRGMVSEGQARMSGTELKTYMPRTEKNFRVLDRKPFFITVPQPELKPRPSTFKVVVEYAGTPPTSVRAWSDTQPSGPPAQLDPGASAQGLGGDAVVTIASSIIGQNPATGPAGGNRLHIEFTHPATVLGQTKTVLTMSTVAVAPGAGYDFADPRYNMGWGKEGMANPVSRLPSPPTGGPHKLVVPGLKAPEPAGMKSLAAPPAGTPAVGEQKMLAPLAPPPPHLKPAEKMKVDAPPMPEPVPAAKAPTMLKMPAPKPASAP